MLAKGSEYSTYIYNYVIFSSSYLLCADNQFESVLIVTNCR